MKSVLNIKESPYGLLPLAAMTILLAIIFTPVANIDFQGKTMFGVPMATMVWIIPFLLLSFWLLYLLTKRFLYSKAITWIHILVTVFATILIVAVLYIGINPPQPASEKQVELIGNAMQILAITFVAGQLTYLANVFLGLVGRYKMR